MTKLTSALLLVGMLTQAQAQLFSRESIGGAALGGLAGGIIGHNNGRKTGEGIAIGAGAGLLLGSLVHQSRREYHQPYYAPPAPAPVYYYESPRPNYAFTGAALGGLAGGIIGHNNGRKTGEGIAIGAGAGLLLGAIAEQEARRREYYLPPAPAYVAPQPPTLVASPPAEVNLAPAPQPPVQQLTPISPGQASRTASSMASANMLFGR